jgi:DNA helicase INO80
VYQKYKQDLEANNKRLAANALKEVRKKAVRTQRLAKESTVRAKKLTKDMLAFWKKRDKELADIKRKKERFDKEMKKRQQEEEEALLQRKRLEYLMKQSEIYAHFMANKMGMTEELKEQKKDVLAEEAKHNYKRVEIDEVNARKRMAKMINEDKRRLKHFD